MHSDSSPSDLPGMLVLSAFARSSSVFDRGCEQTPGKGCNKVKTLLEPAGSSKGSTQPSDLQESEQGSGVTDMHICSPDWVAQIALLLCVADLRIADADVDADFVGRRPGRRQLVHRRPSYGLGMTAGWPVRKAHSTRREQRAR